MRELRPEGKKFVEMSIVAYGYTVEAQKDTRLWIKVHYSRKVELDSGDDEDEARRVVTEDVISFVRNQVDALLANERDFDWRRLKSVT